MQIDNAGHDDTVERNDVGNGHRNLLTRAKHNTFTRPKNNNKLLGP